MARDRWRLTGKDVESSGLSLSKVINITFNTVGELTKIAKKNLRIASFQVEN
jgi:hypothetical protein